NAARVTTDRQAVRARERVGGLNLRREPDRKGSGVRPRAQHRDGGRRRRTAECAPLSAGNADLPVAALVARAVDEVPAVFHATERNAAARVGGDGLDDGARAPAV